MKRIVLFVIVGALMFSCAKNYDAEFEQMLKIADARGDVNEMKPFLEHPGEKVQQKAIVLLGQMRDSAAVPMILPFLQSSSNALVVESAFALGLIGSRRGADALVALYSKVNDLQIKQAIIEAVGHAGDSSHVEFLVTALGEQTPILKQSAAVAIGQLAYWEKIDFSGHSDAFAELLDDDLNEIRWRAAWALSRMADSSAYHYLLLASKDVDPRVRMQCARGLGSMKVASTSSRLAEMAQSDPDWRVRANAATAYGQMPVADVRSMLPFEDENEHVRLSAISAIGAWAARNWDKLSDNDVESLTDFFRERIASSSVAERWRERAGWLSAFAGAAKAGAIDVLREHKSDDNPLFLTRLAEAFGRTASPVVSADLLELYQAGSLPVKIYTLEAAQRLKGGVSNRMALDALQEKDPVLTALATSYLAQDSIMGPRFESQILQGFESLSRPVDTEAASMIFSAMARLKLQGAIPVLQQATRASDHAYAEAAAKALTDLTGVEQAAQPAKKPPADDAFSMAELHRLRKAVATIETGKGAIKLTFFADESPLTVLNFVRLAEKGFYDGLNFHRVVPNFVIQGGDPRGDGWGSPGYSIRSEFNRLSYQRGMVGMASAGPDTEGCQFFITHSEQPHLDGRYTLFARVTDGMDVVDAIQLGDKIERISVQY